MQPELARCVLLVLAGGRGTRMGGADKPLRQLCGRPLLTHVLARLGPSASTTLLSVNDTPERYLPFGAVLLADTIAGSHGPLAGVLSGLDWLADHDPGADLLVVPADTPFLPANLLARLRDARAASGAGVACAASRGRLHPAAGLWRATHAGPVRQALESGDRRLARVMRAAGLGVAEFDVLPVDPFFNVNTPEDLRRAENLCGSQEAARDPPGVDPAGDPPLGSPS